MSQLTVKEKANFVRNLWESVEIALTDNTENFSLGLPVKSIKAPNSKWEVAIVWNEKFGSINAKEACYDGHDVHIDFDHLTSEQLDDLIQQLNLMFVCGMRQDDEDNEIEEEPSDEQMRRPYRFYFIDGTSRMYWITSPRPVLMISLEKGYTINVKDTEDDDEYTIVNLKHVIRIK